ncbi:MAG: single-stranded DNA-binding protein [Brachymonas sp.]|nr:single-stranded DNA-binding protein [Brachymonas sp.]
MNNITITGNLGRDIEIRHLSDGTPIGSFSVADSQGKDKPAIWWNCGLYGKRCESLAPYLQKGQQVTVIGNVTEREWTDKSGQQRKSVDVRVIDIALQGGKPQQNTAAKAAPAQASGGIADMHDDCPF